MNLKPYDLWLTAYKNTREQFEEALNQTTNLPTTFVGHALVDLHHNLLAAHENIEYLKGRIYELEQTIEGQEEAKELVSRSDWAWAEKEED